MSLVDRNQAFFAGTRQAAGFILQKEIPDRVADANDPVDPRVQIACPGDRIEKAQIADDATVGNQADVGAAGRQNSVRDCAVAEDVEDVDLLGIDDCRIRRTAVRSIEPAG